MAVYSAISVKIILFINLWNVYKWVWALFSCFVFLLLFVQTSMWTVCKDSAECVVHQTKPGPYVYMEEELQALNIVWTVGQIWRSSRRLGCGMHLEHTFNNDCLPGKSEYVHLLDNQLFEHHFANTISLVQFFCPQS